MTSAALANDQQFSIQTRMLESWRLEIIAANNAFIHGQNARAFNHYHAALELARSGVAGLLKASELVSIEEAERQIAALVVTRHNLADLFRQSGQLAKVVEHLCAAHEALFQLLHHADSEIRALAQRHSTITYQELLSYIQRHGQHIHIQQTLLLTKYVCICCRRKVAH